MLHTVCNHRLVHPPAWLALLALTLAPPAAVAEPASGDSGAGLTSTVPQAEQPTRLREVLVTAGRLPADAYAAARASVGGKSDVALREIPQSVSVLTRQRIEDQNLIEATRALTWVTGLVDGRSNESDTPLISARGFRVDNVTIDGSLAGATFWQVPSDLSMYEQVEVLRGPTGLFNGSGPTGSAGGAINYRRKRPQADPLTQMEFAVGQWDHYRVTLDAARPLGEDDRLRGRLVASSLDQNDFIAYTGRQNQMIYGVLDFRLSPATLLTVGADHDRRRSVPTYKYSTFRGDGSDPRWPREMAWMVPWARWDGDTTGAFAELAHRFDDDWRLKAAYNYRQEKLFWDWAWVAGVVDPIPGSTQKPLYVTGQRRDTDDQVHTFDVNLTGRFRAWGRTHDLVVGANASQREQVTHQPVSGKYSYDWGKPDTFYIDPSRINIGEAPWRPSVMSGNPTTYRYQDDGVYGNLRLRVLDQLTLTAGGRVSTYEYKGYTNNTVTNKGAYKRSGVVTPYAALTWDFSDSTSAYVSHAEVFSVTNAYKVTGEMVEPVEGNNREIGLKSEFFDGNLLASVAAYRLTRKNQTRIDPSAPYPCPASPLPNAYCYVADNEQQVDGAELELVGRLSRNWQVMLGLSHMKKRYTRWLDGKGAVSGTQGDSWWKDDPDNTVKAWSSYRLPGAAASWRVGGGVRWQSETYAERVASGPIPAARVTQPAFAVWDAMLAWEIDKTWRAQLNVTNLFDKAYYSRVTTSYGSYGEPRRLMLTVRATL
ncbi:TonB-dependent siderophore receptor [Zoogloea sp.]|uniref:TonB-dependent siderophore receptor n=1 Tax=Zoogloea sp. TaxID=49181 RepID=UPI0035AE4ED3